MSNGDSRTNPRVSVIMTAYQDLRFIDAAVNSILAQTYTDFEMVVFDDGANQPDVFARLAALDPRIRIIHSDRILVPMGRLIARSRSHKARSLPGSMPTISPNRHALLASWRH